MNFLQKSRAGVVILTLLPFLVGSAQPVTLTVQTDRPGVAINTSTPRVIFAS